MASDSDNEDIRLAIALSLHDDHGSSTERAIAIDEDVPLSKPEEVLSASRKAGLLGLNRKKMEEERLKRKRIVSPPTQIAHERPSNPNSTNFKRLKSESEPTFLDGVVKKTWALGHPREPDVITLEEILDKDDLQLAVLSSFQWDIDWLFAKMNITKTRLTLVMQAKDDVTKEQYRHETSHLSNIRLCFPNMEGQINCMHSKLMLLSHTTYLRVVIPTANLVSYDWGETGTMENMCFVIDLPRLVEAQPAGKLTLFGDEMLFFLNSQGIEKSVVDSLYKFDFSLTKDLAFVHTIAGTHTGIGEPWRRTGYCGLGRAVKALGLETQNKVNVDFVTSSVGSLNIDFLSALYQACQGNDGLAAYEAKNERKTNQAQALKGAQTQIKSLVNQHFQVYFPTHDTVTNSTAGSAGTICFQSKWYNSPKFPKNVMRDCQSVRDGMLMHNKLIFATSSSKSWAYIGSANCSESAWGNLSKDRMSKQPKLNCRNWECGVLLPSRLRGALEFGNGEKTADEAPSSFWGGLFGGVVPVPMIYPGTQYGGRKPWCYGEQ